MDGTALHIVNGDSLGEMVFDLNLPGPTVVWREMLCEGRLVQEVGSKDFIRLRKQFLKKTYGISGEDYDTKFVSELQKLKDVQEFDYVVLWFEFDLFCHINMLAALRFFADNKKQVPVYLVCSKKLKGEEELKPLSDLSSKQLYNHYKNMIALTGDDLEIANLIWELYCSNEPMRLKQQIKTTSNFEYLSSCIRAHIERFPNSKTGVNSLERNILKLIKKNEISSHNQLLGYALQYQGYYGYSDVQMQRVLKKLEIFYKIQENRVFLTEYGETCLEGKRNFYRELKNDDYLGGAKMYDFLYESESHRLLKL